MTANTQLVPELQHYVYEFIVSSAVNKHQVPVPVDVDSIFLEQGTIVELLFDETFTGSSYKYLYQQVPRTQWPYIIRQRLSLYSSSQYLQASDSTGLNVFNLQHDDLLMADVLLKYRNDSTSVVVVNDSTATSISIVTSGNLTTVTANVNLFSTSLSKLIFLYLDLKINGNYLTYFTLSDVISSNNEVLATCFELKLIDDYFQYIDRQAVSFSLDSSA